MGHSLNEPAKRRLCFVELNFQLCLEIVHQRFFLHTTIVQEFVPKKESPIEIQELPHVMEQIELVFQKENTLDKSELICSGDELK